MYIGTKEEIISALDLELRDISNCRNIAIKINMQSPPTETSPRTDRELLLSVINYFINRSCNVSLIEGANGYLIDNLELIGLGPYLKNPLLHVIDIDLEKDVTFYHMHGRSYALPNILKNYDLRIAIPNASKRPGYLFSCNVKTFVGLLPRIYCNNESNSHFSRPIVHENLKETVWDIYMAIKEHADFKYYINGGNTISEASSIKMLPNYYFSENPVELDFLIAQILKVSPPSYLQI